MTQTRVTCAVCGLSGLCDCGIEGLAARGAGLPVPAVAPAASRTAQRKNGVEARAPTPPPDPQLVDPVVLRGQSTPVAARKHTGSEAELERRVLGALLQAPWLLAETRPQLEAAAFSIPLHRAIYVGMCGICDAGEPLHLMTLMRALPQVPAAELGRLSDEPTAAYLNLDVEKLRELEDRRALEEASVVLRDIDRTSSPEEIRAKAQTLLARVLVTRNEPTAAPLDRALSTASLSVRGWATDEPEPHDWLIENVMLAMKTMLIAGAGGAGKGHLWLQLILALATGQYFGSFPVKAPRRVLVLSLEDTRSDLKRRFRDAVDARWIGRGEREQALPLLEQNIRIADLVGVRGAYLSEEFCEKAAEAAKRDGGCDLIMLDPMTRAVPREENVMLNTQEGAGIVLGRLDQIGTEAGCAVGCVHHTNKPSRRTLEDALDVSAVSGSAQLTDLARLVMMVAELLPVDIKQYDLDPHHAYTAMRIAKNNFAAKPDEISGWRRTGGGALVPVQMTAPVVGPPTERAVRVLERLGEADRDAWVDACGKKGPDRLTQADARAAIAELEALGKVAVRNVRPASNRGRDRKLFSSVSFPVEAFSGQPEMNS